MVGLFNEPRQQTCEAVCRAVHLDANFGEIKDNYICHVMVVAVLQRQEETRGKEAIRE